MPRSQEYYHIRAWGRAMGSYPYYVRQEQEKAAAADAPVNAIYGPKPEKDRWTTADELTDEELRDRINQWAAEVKRNVEGEAAYKAAPKYNHRNELEKEGV